MYEWVIYKPLLAAVSVAFWVLVVWVLKGIADRDRPNDCIGYLEDQMRDRVYVPVQFGICTFCKGRKEARLLKELWPPDARARASFRVRYCKYEPKCLGEAMDMLNSIPDRPVSRVVVAGNNNRGGRG